MPFVENQRKQYTISGKTLREKLNIEGIISNIEIEWKKDKEGKSFPELTINTKIDIEA